MHVWPAFVAVLGSAALAGPLPRAASFLDCADDSAWSEFRELLLENARQGYPKNEDLVALAGKLLQASEAVLAVDPKVAYGASLAMQGFFHSCNAPQGQDHQAKPASCLYGAIAALWVVGRHDHPERHNLLRHAEFLLGSTMRNALDFLESSSWPITSVDVLANLQAVEKGQDFRLPQELSKHYKTPAGGNAVAASSAATIPSSFKHAPIRITVWEIGVHASLSAEPLQMWSRLMPKVEITHRNLIRDQYPKWLPNKCETLYSHARLACDEEVDDITELFRRRIPHSATSKDPIEDIDGFASEFAKVAGPRAQSVDVFLCTIAYLCMIVETIGLPVIGYFGHPLLFMVPDRGSVRDAFWERFVAMARARSVSFTVSDPFLQMQYEYQVGSPRLPAIRTHALYTGATHFPSRSGEVLVLDRPHESVLMCLIRRLMPESSSSQESGMEDWPLVEGRLRAAASPSYPFRFVTRAVTDKQFRTFAQFRSVVLWAYDMDLITFYEFYSMNMPIFMPSLLSKYLFQQDHTTYDFRWARRKMPPDPLWPEAAGASPFAEGSLQAVRHLVTYTDYFRFPEVQYFESVPDLLEKLQAVDTFEVVQAMARFNHHALAETLASWRLLLRQAAGWEEQFL